MFMLRLEAAQERCDRYDRESPSNEYWDEDNDETLGVMAHEDLPYALAEIERLEKLANP